MMKTKIYIIGSLIFFALLTACEKSELPDRIKPADGARVCLINLSADVTTTGTVKTNEIVLYFDGTIVANQGSLAVRRLRGIPYRSSYPGVVTATPAAATAPTSYPGAEYFIAEAGQTMIEARDTAYKAGQNVLFTTTYNFAKDKYYSMFATDLLPTMAPIIVEDDIKPFETVLKSKVRVVNALYGLSGNSIDLWLVHQPGLTALGMPPYKLASNVDYQTVTSFVDTISSGSYKWAVTVAGTEPTAINAPIPDINPEVGLLGKPYTVTFPVGTAIIPFAATGTSFGDRFTYSFLVFGQFGKTGVIAPYANLFRNRIH